MKKIYVFFLIFLCYSLDGLSQSFASHTVKIIANPILELQFDETFNKTEFNFNTIDDYDNGKANLEAVGLKVRSNKNWVISVKAGSPTFLSTISENTEILSKTLSVRKNGTVETIAIETFEQAVASGSNGGFDKNKVVLDYIANPGFIKPDSYSLEVTYTLTTP